VSTLLLATLLLTGGEPQSDAAPATAPNVAGKWLIVYAEQHGRRSNAWEQQQATIEGNTLSYEAEGKQHSLKLHFGQHQTIRVTGSQGGEGGGDRGSSHERHGVYIAGQDYLCISLEGGRGGAGRAARGGAEEQEPRQQEGQEGADKGHGHSSGAFILILRRQR
jgi:hypothetical protein